MTSPIKAGDIVRVTDIDPVEQIDGSHLYECEPLTHSTLTDIDAASVMLERAHHRIGDLTRERDEWEGEAAAGIVRREAEVARLIEDRDNACAARDAAFAREEAYVIEIHTLRGRLDDALDELGDARRPTFAERAAPAEVAEFAVGDWAQATIDGAPVGVPFLVRAVDIERGWLRYACRADPPPPPDGGQEGCPKCFADVPMCPKCAVRKDGCCSDCRLQEVPPLAVGQRWQYEDEGPHLDSFIVQVDGDHVYCDDDDSPWWVNTFRHAHPRLRLPEELEPAPTPPAPQQATPPAEPKTSLPGRGEP